MTLNRTLGAVAIVLFALSLASYRQSVTLTDRFERGQRFLPQLDPDEIHRIEITKAGETTHLRRVEDSFVIEEMHNHRARNENVNRFLRDVLEIELEKEVGDDPDLHAELDLEPGGEETIEIAFENAAGQEMVKILLGSSLPTGGTYLRRADGEHSTVYLTGKQLFLSTEADRFLDKEILHAEREELARIRGSDYVLESADGSWTLAELPAGRELDSGKTSRLESLPNRLQFEAVFRADDPELPALDFAESLQIDLDDSSGYRLSLASSGDKHYLLVGGFHDVQRVEITREESEDELKEKADVLQRADEMNLFNQSRASWIYEVRESVAETIRFGRDDLLREAS